MKNKENLIYGLGAAGMTILPAALVNVVPSLSGYIPACTGVCGSCGGGCMGAVGTIAWMGIVAKVNKDKQVNKEEE